MVNGANLTSDRFGNLGKAFDFDGLNNVINLNLQQNQITSYSVAGWFKSNVGGPIISGRGSNNQTGLTLALHNYACGGINNGRIIFVADGSPVSIGKLTSQQYIDDQWHFVVGIFDGQLGAIHSDQFKVYIDNQLLDQLSSDSYSANAPLNNGTNILLGAHQIWQNCQFFKGKLDDIAIYNRALTQNEVTQLYTNTVIPSTTEDTTFNVGIGTTNPKRKLHINDVMRLEPRDTAPTNPGEGDIYYDATIKKLRYYNGTSWISL